jgi:hypothetical protein
VAATGGRPAACGALVVTTTVSAARCCTVGWPPTAAGRPPSPARSRSSGC